MTSEGQMELQLIARDFARTLASWEYDMGERERLERQIEILAALIKDDLVWLKSKRLTELEKDALRMALAQRAGQLDQLKARLAALS
jgi:hypothetical protein